MSTRDFRSFFLDNQHFKLYTCLFHVPTICCRLYLLTRQIVSTVTSSNVNYSSPSQRRIGEIVIGRAEVQQEHRGRCHKRGHALQSHVCGGLRMGDPCRVRSHVQVERGHGGSLMGKTSKRGSTQILVNYET